MIYDCFTFFNELDLLEIRFNILDPYVDKFVLVESEQTFTGIPKPLYYAENKERFKKWEHKIVHIIAPNMEIEKLAFERHWLCYELIEKYLLANGEDEDIVYCSDLDEIWVPQNVDDDVHSLIQLNYCYYLNQRSSEQWTGTLVTKIKNIFVGFNKHFRSVKPNLLPNGGWHFTNMGGVDQIIKKTTAYDHGPELNHEWIKDNIQNQIDTGGDFLGRSLDYEGKPYKFWREDSNLPEYLKENKEKYKEYFKWN